MDSAGLNVTGNLRFRASLCCCRLEFVDVDILKSTVTRYYSYRIRVGLLMNWAWRVVNSRKRHWEVLQAKVSVSSFSWRHRSSELNESIYQPTLQCDVQQVLNSARWINAVLDPERQRAFPGTTSVNGHHWSSSTNDINRRIIVTMINFCKSINSMLSMKKLPACKLSDW